MRKNLGRNISILLIITSLIISCTKSPNKGDIRVLKVYENIDKQNRSFSLDQLAGDKEIIAFETTENALISDVKIAFVTHQYICLLNRSMLLFFDHSGKYQFTINSKGNGPSEYNQISNVFYNSSDSTLYIHDTFKKKIIEFELNGDFIRGFTIDDIGSITNLDNNHYVACYSPFANKKKLVAVFDNDFQLMNEFIITDFNNENYTKKGYIMINGFTHTNQNKCIKPISSDTVYQIYPDKVEPLFFMDKGSLTIPIELISDFSQRDNTSIYITDDYGLIANNLYFMSFYYNNKLYQDIWDIKNCKLLFRNILSSVDDKYGVPIQINNEIIHVWPIFVHNQSVYCKIDEGDQLLFKSNVEDNDILLKLTLS